MNKSPYRNVFWKTYDGRVRVRYFPCAGVWPLLLALAVGLPLAAWARRDARVPSTITCSTVSVPGSERQCFVHDARSLEAMRRVSCRATPASLEAYLETSNPLVRPVVLSTEIDMPELPDARKSGKECVDSTEDGAGVTPPPALPPLFTPTVDAAEGITPAQARDLVGRCAMQPDTSGPPRTISLSIYRRDYLLSACLLGGLLAAALLSMLRRRTVVDIDRDARRIDVLERGWFRSAAVRRIDAADVEAVKVEVGPCGMLNGRRVELVLREGKRAPLLGVFVPLTSRVHTRTARRVSEALSQLKPAPVQDVPARGPRGRLAAAAALGVLVVLAGAGVAVRMRLGRHDASSSAPHLTRVGAERDGSTLVVASFGSRRIALVADEDARAIRAIEAPSFGDVTDGRAESDVFNVPMGTAPGPMVIDGRGRLFVALPREAAVAVLEATSGATPTLREVERIATAAEPVALSITPDDATLVVVCDYAHTLETFGLAKLESRLQVELPRSPRSLVLSADGASAFVAHNVGSWVSRVDLAAGRYEPLSLDARPPSFIGSVTGEWGVGAKPSPLLQPRLARFGDQVLAPGILVTTGDPNVRTLTNVHEYYSSNIVNAFDLAQIQPDGRVQRLRDRLLTPLGRAVIINGKGPGGRKPASGATPQSCVLPRAAVTDGKRSWLYVVCTGPGRVFKVDLAERKRCFDEGAWGAAYDVPDGPTGMAVDEPDRTLLVWSQFTQSITALPLEPGRDVGFASQKWPGPTTREAPVEWVHALTRTARSAHEEVLDRGRALFFRGDDPRIGGSFGGGLGGGVACASCHIDGRDDALTWPTAQGPRQTPMLAGRLVGTAPYGWLGEEPTLPSHLEETFKRLGGVGLPPDDLNALVSYIESIPAPHFTVVDRPSVARGRALFDSDAVGCWVCHATGDDLFTDNHRHDIGSRTKADFSGAFDTPSLLFVGSTAPYFHDGRYPTLLELLAKTDGAMGHTAQLDEGQRRDLVAYLRSLGASTPGSHESAKEARAW